jgi:hypothetical protein
MTHFIRSEEIHTHTHTHTHSHTGKVGRWVTKELSEKENLPAEQRRDQNPNPLEGQGLLRIFGGFRQMLLHRIFDWSV